MDPVGHSTYNGRREEEAHWLFNARSIPGRRDANAKALQGYIPSHSLIKRRYSKT